MLIFGGIAIVAVLLLSIFAMPNNSNTDKEAKVPSNVISNNGEQENAPMGDENASWYTAYSEKELEGALSSNQKTVIFFHAGWCPTCIAASEDFQANINQIPSDVTILKADYDAETELKEKYGVVMQDTFIQVNSDGEEIAKWNSGGEGISTLLANLK